MDLSTAADPCPDCEQTAKAIEGLPGTTEVFVRLRIEAAAATSDEKQLGAAITQALDRIPLADSRVRGLVLEFGDPLPQPDLLRFVTASIATKARADKPGLQIIFYLPPGFIAQQEEVARKLAVYSDVIATDLDAGWRDVVAFAAQEALGKPVCLRVDCTAATGPESFVDRFMEAVLALSGVAVDTLLIDLPDQPAMSRVCATAQLLAQKVGLSFSVVDAASSPFSVSSDGGPLHYAVFNDSTTPDVAILAQLGETAGTARRLTLRGPATEDFGVEWVDPVAVNVLKPDAVVRAASGIEQICTGSSRFLLIVIRKLAAPEEAGRERIEVTAPASLTVDEIVARWQQYREAQRRLVQAYISNCFLTLHFEPAGVGGTFDISMRFRQFWSASGLSEWVQTEFYVNGVRFKGRRDFPLPQLEPEKVLTQPLELKLDEKYSYSLLGMDTVDGAVCYVVGFEPVVKGETLYRGKVWIDGATFRHVRMDLSQRGGKSNVISNAERQEFALVSDGSGNQVNLLRSIYAQQMLNAAGRSFLLEKTYSLSDFTINPADFQGSLDSARRSDDPMFRDTDVGLRTLKKKGDERVLQPDIERRIKSIVAGVLYEGSLEFPVPLFGFSLVDFNFRDTSSQLSIFFAGPLLAANLTKQWEAGHRVGLDVALSALPGQSRVYSGDTEVKEQGMWAFSETAGARASWQAADRLSVTGTFYLTGDIYRRTSDTDPAYSLPRNGLTLSPGLELKWSQHGYSATAGGWYSRRLAWRGYGYEPEDSDATHQSYSKYYGILSKNFYFGRFSRAGLELSYYGGDRLDRFSKYSPSYFSQPRLAGIPSGTEFFDSIATAGAAYEFNIMDFIRCGAKYSHAWGKNAEEWRGSRDFDGIEVDFATAGPWSTYVQGIVTYALRGNLDRYETRWGAYLLIYKPLS
ncbi:MAG: hypothetical protein AB1714_18630 [Acidobacteriota bacterium]